MSELLTLSFVLFAGGVISARFSGWLSQSWLRNNTGWHDNLGFLRRLLGIFGDFGPIMLYSQARKQRQMGPTLAYVFWGGLGAGLLGLLGIFVTLSMS
jgi:hypothetical protein